MDTTCVLCGARGEVGLEFERLGAYADGWSIELQCEACRGVFVRDLESGRVFVPAGQWSDEPLPRRPVRLPTDSSWTPTEPRYAGVWPRAVALALDAVVLVAVVQALWLVVFGPLGSVSSGGGLAGTALDVGVVVAGSLVAWLYFAVGESSRAGGTIGKRALGLVVTDADGRSLTFRAASERFLARILAAIPLLGGLALVWLTRRRQGLHDLLCHSYVVHRRRPDPRGYPRR